MNVFTTSPTNCFWQMGHLEISAIKHLLAVFALVFVVDCGEELYGRAWEPFNSFGTQPRTLRQPLRSAPERFLAIRCFPVGRSGDLYRLFVRSTGQANELSTLCR